MGNIEKDSSKRYDICKKLKEAYFDGKIEINKICSICLKPFEKNEATFSPKTPDEIKLCEHNYHKKCWEALLKESNRLIDGKCQFCLSGWNLTRMKLFPSDYFSRLHHYNYIFKDEENLTWKVKDLKINSEKAIDLVVNDTDDYDRITDIINMNFFHAVFHIEKEGYYPKGFLNADNIKTKTNQWKDFLRLLKKLESYLDELIEKKVDKKNKDKKFLRIDLIEKNIKEINMIIIKSDEGGPKSKWEALKEQAEKYIDDYLKECEAKKKEEEEKIEKKERERI